ncbi:MAG: amidohydrolase [Phycisphaerae bacterium]|nr:amidohydrolase [Phycisphaerae bacterium]
MTSLLLLAVTLVGQPLAFTNAYIIPVEGPEIQGGTLLVQDGRIVALGRNVSIPADAVIQNCAGQVIMPGLVCTHSHIGGWGGADRSGPIQPDARIIDALNPRSSGWKRALAGGLTTLNVMPGSGHLLSGQTVYLKLRPGVDTIGEMAYRFPDGSPMGGIKMANGTNPQGDPPFPGTRSKAAALVRQKYLDAQKYQRELAAGANGGKSPDRDLGLEAMVEALEGKRVVHHHTHRADDIVTVLRLADEFNFRLVLHHVSEAMMVAEEIAEANVPCSVIMIDSPGGKQEAVNLSFETGRILDEHGVKVAYHTDDYITDSRYFFRSAALGIRAGLSRSTAFASLTLHGAEMIDLGKRVGSLLPGKDADFVILSGDPFSIDTRVHQTWVEGQLAFDLARPSDRLFAEGGFGASNEVDPYMCCTKNECEGCAQ